jgi:hypothetical protein
MKKRIYFWSFVVLLSSLITFSGCSPRTGCPAVGTKATKKERKKGGNSNLFDKKTRRKIG